MSKFAPGIAGLIFALLALPAARAEVRLPSVFSDHAVLQRGQPVHVWGWSAPEEKVTVHFHDQTRKATADEYGRWQVWLMPEKAGGPYKLTVTGSETKSPIERSDILVGDVWVASGQSNMEFPLRGFYHAPMKNSAQEIAAANHPRIRLLHVAHAQSELPLDDIHGEWTGCTPKTAATLSAVAYFFAREISAHEKVPIGLIESDWGGTPAQSWVSWDALGRDEYSPAIRDGADVAMLHAFGREVHANFAAQNAVLQSEGNPPLKRPHIPVQAWIPHFPSVLFNGMIVPLTGYTIKGVIWYQGASDSLPQRAKNYSRIFPLLINDWRRHWNEGDFPFLYAQISSYKGTDQFWGEVRDAQRQTLSVRNTGMAVTLDVGEADNVHPPDKQTVGARLAAIALAKVYGQKGAYASPEFREATVEGNAIRVWFTHAQGLNARGKPVGGFEVASEDGAFVPADAKIEKIDGQSTVVVSAGSVPNPHYVRYGWNNMVTHFLYNSAGFPLGTFTSEQTGLIP
ncbi:MAG: sialate O-acetylesterase [Acidobacteriaceae bacterium]